MNSDQKTCVQLPEFKETFALTSWNFDEKIKKWICDADEKTKILDVNTSIYQAMILGLSDYVNKTVDKNI